MAETKRTRLTGSKQLPDTARWNVKGDGVAYTTSKDILNSQAGRRHISEAAKVHLLKRG